MTTVSSAQNTLNANVSAVNNEISSAAANSSAGSSSTLGTSASLASLSSNFTDFISLLTTQLKNQDPTSPTDTDQFTQELIGFSQVQQEVDTNTNLTNLISQTKSAGVNSSINYLNQQVDYSGDSFNLKSGKPMPTLGYTLPSNAASVSIAITDKNGNAINTLTSTTTGITAGPQTISWNGEDANGDTVTDGDYNFAVTAKDSSGNTISGVTTNVTDYVSQVGYANGASTLYFGDLPISTDNVVSVKGYYSQSSSSLLSAEGNSSNGSSSSSTPATSS